MSVPAWRTAEIRYAPYIENRFADLLNTTAACRVSMIVNSPYDGYLSQKFDEAFFGVGYAIADFPSIYDMYGKFLSGFDVESIWHKSFSTVTTLDELNTCVNESITSKDAELTQSGLPEFKLRMRELGAVNSSSFVVGKAQIETQRTKALGIISADVKFKMLDEAHNKFVNELNWSNNTVRCYASIMQLYYMTAASATDANYKFDTSDTLWPMKVLDFERSVLGALRPQPKFSAIMLTRKRSTLSTVLSIAADTVTGAMVGAACGNYIGAIVGAVIGFIVGVAKMLLE